MYQFDCCIICVQCKAELASDEDIFADKVQELEELRQQLADRVSNVQSTLSINCWKSTCTDTCINTSGDNDGKANTVDGGINR
jgi:hypothetical protein